MIDDEPVLSMVTGGSREQNQPRGKHFSLQRLDFECRSNCLPELTGNS